MDDRDFGDTRPARTRFSDFQSSNVGNACVGDEENSSNLLTFNHFPSIQALFFFFWDHRSFTFHGASEEIEEIEEKQERQEIEQKQERGDSGGGESR